MELDAKGKEQRLWHDQHIQWSACDGSQFGIMPLLPMMLVLSRYSGILSEDERLQIIGDCWREARRT